MRRSYSSTLDLSYRHLPVLEEVQSDLLVPTDLDVGSLLKQEQVSGAKSLTHTPALAALAGMSFVHKRHAETRLLAPHWLGGGAACGEGVIGGEEKGEHNNLLVNNNLVIRVRSPYEEVQKGKETQQLKSNWYQIVATTLVDALNHCLTYLQGEKVRSLIIDIHGSYKGPSFDDALLRDWPPSAYWDTSGALYDLTEPKNATTYTDFTELDKELNEKLRRGFKETCEILGTLLNEDSEVYWASCAADKSSDWETYREETFKRIYNWAGNRGSMYYSDAMVYVIRRSYEKYPNEWWIREISGENRDKDSKWKRINVEEGEIVVTKLSICRWDITDIISAKKC
jgi:hypothetical protein